jgi:hypothetical protein
LNKSRCLSKVFGLGYRGCFKGYENCLEDCKKSSRMSLNVEEEYDFEVAAPVKKNTTSACQKECKVKRTKCLSRAIYAGAYKGCEMVFDNCNNDCKKSALMSLNVEEEFDFEVADFENEYRIDVEVPVNPSKSNQTAKNSTSSCKKQCKAKRA